MLFSSIYQEQDTSHAATQAPPHAWRARSSCGETEQWLRLSCATMVWDHEEAVRPVSGRSGLRLGVHRSAPRARHRHRTRPRRSAPDRPLRREPDVDQLLLTRVMALRVVGRVPLAGREVGWGPLRSRRSMAV